MMIEIPALLDADEIVEIRAILDGAAWVDGNATSGFQSALAKRNRQLSEDSKAAHAAGAIILAATSRCPLFIAAALPLKIFPPLFSRYEGGDAFGIHVDNAVRLQRGSDFRVRSDLSATVFLEDPDAYEGGELAIEDQFGVQRVKLPAGNMILYPSSSLHRVEQVTRGQRLVSFLWLQSMIRDGEARRTLFELDMAVQTLAQDRGQDDRAIIQLTGVYHNLLRRWADS